MKPTIKFFSIIAAIIAITLGILSIWTPMLPSTYAIILLAVLFVVALSAYEITKATYSPIEYSSNTYMYLMPNIVRETDTFLITKMQAPTPSCLVKIVRTSKMYENGIIINDLVSPTLSTCPKEYLLTKQQVFAMRIGLYTVPKAITLISIKKSKIKENKIDNE